MTLININKTSNSLAYGFKINSELPLLNKINVKGKDPELYCDISVRKKKLDSQFYKSVNINSELEVYGELPNVGKFLIQNGNKIFVDLEPDVDKNILSAVIFGTVMSVILQQKGYLVLHASCVKLGDKTIAFLGHSGAGKSTICSAFHAQGYQVLTDDVMAIDIKENNFLVIPSVPEVKLYADSASKTNLNEGKQSPFHLSTGKKVYQLEQNFATEPAKLSKLYVLGRGGQNEISEIAPQNQFIELMRNTRAANSLRSQDLELSHFQKSMALAQNVPISLLKRKLSLEGLPKVIELIKQDLW